MAGDGDGNAVGGAGTGDGAHGLRRADTFGELRVADSGASGDLAQGLPDALLEGGAADIKRESEAELGCFHEGDDLSDGLLKCLIAAEQLSLRELVLEVAEQLIGVIAEGEGTDAFGRRGDEEGAERAFGEGEADGFTGAAGAKALGSHAEGLGGFFVEAAVGVEAGFVDGLGDGGALGQSPAHCGVAMSGGVGLGREAGVLLEEAVEMEPAQTGGPGQGVEGGRSL